MSAMSYLLYVLSYFKPYDSKLVFRFSLLLHFHTSCSYRLHKSCSYGVYSLQEFKQNEARKAAAAVIIALICEKNKARKKRQEIKVGMKPWLK